MSHHPPPPLPLGDTPLPLDAPKCPSQELLDMPPRPSSSSTASSHVRWRRGLNDRSQSYADNAVERGSYWQPFDSSNCNPNGGLCAPDTYSRSSHLHLPLPLSHGHPKNPGFWEPECERRRDPFFNRSCLPHNSFFEGGLEHPQGRRLADPYLPLPPPPATHVLPHNSRDQSFTSQPPLPNGWAYMYTHMHADMQTHTHDTSLSPSHPIHPDLPKKLATTTATANTISVVTAPIFPVASSMPRETLFQNVSWRRHWYIICL